jgi:hypothetical protein
MAANPPLTIADLYQQYAGRAPDPEGLAYWTKDFGDTIDPREIGVFQTAVAEARAQGTEPAAQPAATFTSAAPASVSDQAVTSWLQSNPGASDATIAAAMNQYGVTPDQMARVTGLDTGAVQTRYNAALPSSAAATPTYFQQNPDVAAAYQANSYGMTPDQFAATHFQNYGVNERRAAPASAPPPDYGQMVRDAYASIGRTGIGTAASNIDQAGFDNWVSALQSGSINPSDLTNTFRSSVADYLIANPADQYSTYVTDFLSDTRPADVAGIVDLYRDVLGRDPDAAGLGNWFQQFGSEISPEERAQFELAAMPEKQSSVPDSVFNTYKTIYGVEPDAGTLAQLTNRFGPTFDANEIRELVVNDFSLRDDPRGVVKTLQQQILDQGFTDKWSGEGFGSAEKNAADMARMLATAGITDINQFGKISVPTDAAVTPVYEQKPMYDPELGEYMGQVIVGYKDANGKAVDPNSVRTEYDDAGNFSYIAPVGTKEVFGNKETGVALDPRYDRAQGNIFSGTFAGDGSTGYGVQFRADGTPVFYTQYGGSTNTLNQIMSDLGPLGQIAFAVATGGLSIPQQIAAQAALSLASGADIGDIAKNIATSLILSKIPGSDLIKDGTKYLNSIDSSGVLSNAFKSAAASGTRAALTGKDIGDAILSGAIGGGAAGAIDLMAEGVEGFGDLSKSQQNMVKTAISGVVSGRPLDQVLINAAIQAGKDAVRTAPKGLSKVAGLDEDGLPTGIQVASADGETPFRTEVSGAPIFADSPGASRITPPPGYRLMATTEEQQIQDGDRTRYVKPAGSYYDITANAWFSPTGEFDAATNVTDYSALFGGDRATLTDADIAAIRGTDVGTGAGAADLDFDYSSLIGGPSGEPNLGELLVTAPRPPAADMGEMVVTAPRPPADDLGELFITAPRPPADDMGEMVITAPRPPADDLGEIVVTAPRETLPIETLPEEEFPEMVITAPRDPVVPEVTTPPVTPKTPPVTPTVTPPAKVTPRQVARMLGVPVSSPIVQDVIEALYGTMEYLDISEEFKPSERKAKPAATQKQLQQTKMAQGGYLDDLLAENMSADDLLNLLR